MNKNKKYIAILSLILCSVALMTGCKKDDVPETTTPSGPHLIDESVQTSPSEESSPDTTEITSTEGTLGADETTKVDKNDPNHVHNYTVASTSEASCEKAGTVSKQCVCGSTRTETVAALGHDYKETTSTEATCTTAGSSVKVCSRCKDKKTETIPAKGHNYKVTSTTKATCSANGSEVKTCSNCNDKQTITLPKLNHTYKTTKTAATCTIEGKEVSKCSTCGSIGQSKTIPALGHDWNDKITKEATCKEEGSMDRKCKRCNKETVEKIEKSAHTYETVETPPSCEGTGKREEVCSVCGNVKTRTALAATGHQYVETVIKAATCTETGIVTNICSECKKETGETTIPVLGHDYQETNRKNPTCTETGLLTEICARCEDARTTEIPATGHTEDVAVSMAPTCAEDGVGHKTCLTCSADLGECAIPKLTVCDPTTIAPCEEYVDSGFTCDKCSVCGSLSNVAFTTSQEEAAHLMLDFVNEIRTQNGLTALTLSDSLNGTARNRAQALASNYHSDNPNELISRNNTSLKAIFDIWSSSDLLLNPDYTTIGFGYYVGNSPSLFAVLIFE